MFNSVIRLQKFVQFCADIRSIQANVKIAIDITKILKKTPKKQSWTTNI